MRIRVQLAIIAAVVFVPGFLAAVVAVQKVREAERQAGLRGLHETVRASALLVDREIHRSIGALTALGHSDYLRTGNFKGFYNQALASSQPHVWTLLLDETGTQVLNTAVPFGTPPPPPASAKQVAQALSTNRLLVTGLIEGPATGQLLTMVYMPANEWNGKRYVVAQAFSVDHWKATALQLRNGSPATIAVIDRTGKFISRNLNADTLLGKHARPELVAAAASATEGLIRHPTLEGTDTYQAYTHSELTGWTVAVAMPFEVIESSATQAVLWLTLAGALALAAALSAAAFLGRNVLRVIEVASDAARSLGEGTEPAVETNSLREVKDLYAALVNAGHRLVSERRSREAAEAERENLLERERALREAAQRENAAKDQFLALLGHELRNPLAAISGATAVLQHPQVKPEVTGKFLAIIQRQNQHLSHIIDDLLDVSRLASGKISLVTSRVNLAESARNCVQALGTTERARGYSLVLNTEDVWVVGDAVRIEQIVNNLVTNAIKYSAPGTQIEVKVSGVADQALLEVVDQGEGISADLLPRVFEPFVQGPALPGRLQSGLGIGLSLVKQLVALHGGEVVAESLGEHRGATFRVTLPKADAGGAT